MTHGTEPRGDLTEQELDAMLRGAHKVSNRRRGIGPDFITALSANYVCLDPNEARAIVEELRRHRRFLFELRSKGTATIETVHR